MADRALSTSRRALLGAAASIPFLPLASVRAEPVEAPPVPPNREAWGRNLARYQNLFARAKKAEETGWFQAAHERWYRESADPGTDRKAAFARMTRAENLFWHRCTAPMQEAAEALVLTRPPDLEALGAKLSIIRAHDPPNPGCLGRDWLGALEADVRSLGVNASTGHR